MPKFEHMKDGSVWFYCPGCECHHRVDATRWKITGAGDRITIYPSIRNDFGDGRICHMYVISGQLKYLNDCWHKLAGQTINPVEADITHGDES